jgi:outer membrane protein TolC
VLQGPTLTSTAPPGSLPEGQPGPADRPLPINLATALRLSDARPLLIAAAQARVQIAAAQLEKASVLWLPNINAGADYIRHDGGNQNIVTAALVPLDTNFFYAGGSLEVRVSTTDAIFEPLAARQDLRAREAGVQTARNEALLQTAQAYFTVQEARGVYAAMTDATSKARDLVQRVQTLAKGLAAPDEIDRARTLLASLEQAVASGRQQWRVSSARLTRVLRLNPATVVVPLEPDHLQVTLISPTQPVDDLIPIGLTNRPELAEHQALVQATLARLKQEKLRPVLPSILITGNGTPDFLYQAGIFATGSNGDLNHWGGRADVSAQVVWKMENLGFGNQARIRERKGQVQLATVELFNVQDQVAEEIVQAQADLESAAVRVGQAETGLKQGLETFAGNLKGLGQTTRFGDVLVLVNRPQEVVAALTQLQQAYVNYFRTVAEYNRAQFRLFYTLGYPAAMLACERTPGIVQPVDTMRPGYLPPVCSPPPCSCPR